MRPLARQRAAASWYGLPHPTPTEEDPDAVPRILVCSYLEPQWLDAIRAVDPRVEVTFRPDLIPAPRVVADHDGAPFVRDEPGRTEWAALMRDADVLFDFDRTDPESLLRDGLAVRWVQATSAGIGQYVERHGLQRPGLTLTTASGVHARPLAEFVLWGMLAFAKSYPLARRQQREGVWRLFVCGELEGATLAVVGLGAIGREVARLARAVGMRVIGTKRTLDGASPADLGVDALVHWDDRARWLGEADHVCLVMPHTRETAGAVDAATIAAMRRGSVLINIGRGSAVDERALLDALASGHLAGAVLDVAPYEPLPADHPLWSMDNVIVYPHSAATSVRENERLTELFCDNLRRWLDGRPLRNVYRPERQY